MSRSLVKAVLFDVDGTLIDSNDLHVDAWLETFEHFGVAAATPEAVRSQIGKGGDQLIPMFVPPPQLERLQPEIEAFRGELYARKYLPSIKAFRGVRPLFERLKAAGVKCVLASSGKAPEVARAKTVAGIADLIDAETNGDDVENSKPAPDIFAAALAKVAPIRPEEAVAIGDSPYDAESARGSGLRTIGVLSGGFSRDALEAAGCVAVYADLAALLADYDHSPLAGH